MYIRAWFVLVLTLQSCGAVIYHLNDTDYLRMPPLFSLDDYESCLVEDGSTYCMLQLNLYADAGNELMRMITEYSDHRVKHYNHSLIDRGICVQKTCKNYISNTKTTEDLTRSLEGCLNDSLRREYGLNARVSSLYYCDRHNEPRDIDGWDWAVLAVVLGLVAVNIVGNTYEYILSKQGGNTDKCGNMFLLSFSIARNWKWLTDTESNNTKLPGLQFLDGARVISNICIVLAHVMMIFTFGFTINSHDIEKSFEFPSYLLIYNGMMIVQIFFFISGFLTVYKLSFEMETRTFTAWDIPKIIVLRLSRLVPVLAVTLALTTTWVRHAGSGPLWKLYVSGSLVADCRNYWWHTLLFFNNYMTDNKYCLIPTWHLATEMQVFVVGVTAYMATRGRARRMVLGGLLLLSAAAPALHTALQDLDAITITPEFYRTMVGSTFRFQHILGHNNLPCFVMGMATATRIYNWLKKGGHLAKNWWFSLFQYLSVAAIPLILYSGSVFYKDSARAPLLARAAYSAAVRLLLGLTCALAAPALFVRTSTLFKSMLEWRCWVVPSRLTYCVFLLHMILVHIAVGARMQLTHFSGFHLLSAHVCVLVASYLVSVPFYLLVEAPFTMLFKSYVMKSYAQASVGSRQAEKEKNV